MLAILVEHRPHFPQSSLVVHFRDGKSPVPRYLLQTYLLLAILFPLVKLQIEIIGSSHAIQSAQDESWWLPRSRPYERCAIRTLSGRTSMRVKSCRRVVQHGCTPAEHDECRMAQCQLTPRCPRFKKTSYAIRQPHCEWETFEVRGAVFQQAQIF